MSGSFHQRVTSRLLLVRVLIQRPIDRHLCCGVDTNEHTLALDDDGRKLRPFALLGPVELRRRLRN